MKEQDNHVVMHPDKDPQTSSDLCLKTHGCRMVSLYFIVLNGSCFSKCFHTLFIALQVLSINRELWKCGLHLRWTLCAGPAPGLQSQPSACWCLIILYGSCVEETIHIFSSLFLLSTSHWEFHRPLSHSSIISFQDWNVVVCVIFLPTEHAS